MLTILNDPAGITGRRRIAFDYSLTLQQNIERHLSGGGDCDLRINGSLVDPLQDPRLDMPPGRDDLVIITVRPRGLEVLSYAAYAAYAVAAVAVYAYARSLQPPNFDGASGKDSPNNKLTGQSNVARAYQAVPDVFGYRRVWPDLIQPSTVEYIDQVKYVTEWLCVSRGLGMISDVQYAETPIGDIDGSSYEVFEPVPVDAYPELGSTTLNDVYESFSSDEVNGQELPYAVAFAQLVKTGAAYEALNGATTFTVTLTDGPDLAQLKSLAPSGTAQVAFSFGAGPTSFNETCTVLSYSGSGSITFTFSSSAWGSAESGTATITITPVGSVYESAGPFTLPVEAGQIWWSTVFLRGLKGTITVRAEWWKVDGAGAEVAGSRQFQDDVYAADTFDQRFYTKKATPAAGPGRYRVQFTRRTVKVDENGADVAKLEEVYAVRHFPTKTLPGVTGLRVTTKATLSATGFSDRKFNLRWSRLVREIDSDDLSVSRNFARIMAHIWTVAGNDVEDLDVAALAEVNDEHGEDSPMLRFDGSLDDADMSLGERMQLVANTARCMVWRDGTKWTVTRDQARPYPELQLDYRNLAASGESGISFGAHLPASFDGVELEYVDEISQAKKSYERWSIASGAPVPGTSSNPKKVKMPGCATQAQAENRALLEARRLIYQRTSVSDTALADASQLGIGALVRWIDPNDFAGDDGLQAGEVMSVAGNLITTSEPVDWKGATSGRILFTGADGRHLGSPVLCYPSGDAVQLASVPAGLYVADPARQCGSRYAFGVGLTDAEMQSAGLYTASEVRPSADGTVSLSLASYDERIYEGDA